MQAHHPVPGGDAGDRDDPPVGIDAERPSAARMYDYYLGGVHNFAVDRRYAQRIIALHPEVPRAVHANRAFLRRAVRTLVGLGVRQFLDIGSGIPTAGHVHEIARETAPATRVVYVDIDPVAVAHSRDLLAGVQRTAVVQADVRHPERLLAHPAVRDLLDLDQPVAVLLVALLHVLPDVAAPADLVARLVALLPSGSYVALSHGTADGLGPAAPGLEVYRSAGIDMVVRTRAQVEALFGGLELIEPGLVWGPCWRPEPGRESDDPAAAGFYAGVARKP